ncbi:hypothetical protein [Hydrogenophaga sp.]|uniref:hypothetical protein n=1 Tax=Hydrogenophaga sp. TaxID=1904254 RepID=UPI0019AFCF96|nr:hypothetical protein [Hydrogenophaga sp.]MBD3893403.1 hypothetical protein [Hydrogenophaga sp.]
MADAPSHLLAAIYAKTALGQQEIQSRSLGLLPLARRVLVLVDGKRSGHDLSAFVSDHNVAPLLSELLARGCIDVLDSAAPAAASAAAKPKTPEKDDLAGLPAPDSRSAQELEMARSLMANALDYVFDHYGHSAQIESINACRSHSELRALYPSWTQAMDSHAIGKKILPGIRVKLLAVL